MDRFFEYLVVDLEVTAPEIGDLNWGSEILQLPPALVAVVRPEIHDSAAQLAALPAQSPSVVSPPVRVLFLFFDSRFSG